MEKTATAVEVGSKELVRGRPTIREICADGDIVVIFFDGKVTRASAMFDSVEFNDFWSRVSPAE
jgi:hypothetical protein